MSGDQDRTLDWARIQEVFHRALELEGTHRALYLDQATAGDLELRAEVESLLAHATGGMLGEPVERPPAAGAMEARFGPYRIVRPLGEGGMGRVYLAERTGAGFTQRVALKVLRGDLLSGSPEVERRFTRERQILARLEHPGIARLIDGGYGPGDQPYLAMEYVEGETLADYVGRCALSIETRLDLFIAVCEAVHYAHQHLVIHRDLKPSNIVITATGDPKLLDFGIATLVEGEDDARSGEFPLLRTGNWFTPAYSSPEQVRQERVTTLSDIYSLGVLLYELLTCARPYEVVDLSPAAVEEVVCRRLPERPSARVGDSRLARRLRGDLDTIVLKALAKEPERRYRSAQGLAEDLRRHMEHEPVSARPDSLGYRLQTFARRNRTAVTGALLALVALTAGLVTTSWQAREAAAARERAEAALGRSEEVTRFLIELFQQSDPALAPVDAAFARGIVESGRARVGELRDQPLVQARLLDALGLVTLSLRDVNQARALMEQSVAIRRTEEGEGHLDYAIGLQHLGRVRRVEGRYAKAESLYVQALGIMRDTVGTDHPAYTDALSDLAFLLPYLSRTPEAEQHYREVVAIRRRILPPGDPLIADAVLRVAATLRAQRKFVAAESAGREGFQLRLQSLGPTHPQVGAALFNLADILVGDSSRWAEAESLYLAGMAVQRRAIGPNYLGIAHGLGNLAALYRRERRLAEAESLARRTLELRELVMGPKNVAVVWDKASLAAILADRGALDEAIAVQLEAVETLERTYGPDHSDVAGILAGLARLQLRKGRLMAAETLLVRSVAIRERAHGRDNLHGARDLATLGQISLRRREYGLAEQRLIDALDRMRAATFAEPGEIEAVRRDLAAAYRGLGRPADAARYATTDST
ncbi:MAG: serine/threonine-protein kinase [Gemmatimonadota bacterium]|nr:serine/threonine-protein kinase [Gemmatimonadota bacterium]